jgi:hypothetical protein
LDTRHAEVVAKEEALLRKRAWRVVDRAMYILYNIQSLESIHFAPRPLFPHWRLDPSETREK